jgi:DNA polymerase phi
MPDDFGCVSIATADSKEDRQAKKFSKNTTMELYEQLASNEENLRIKAAEELVRKVVNGGKTGHTEKGIDSEYALNRLVKGLSSGRESARLGFSIALTEV